MKHSKPLLCLALMTFVLIACNHKAKDNDDEAKGTKSVKTPVTVASITEDNIIESVTPVSYTHLTLPTNREV